jgi:hypothetical protein
MDTVVQREVVTDQRNILITCRVFSDKKLLPGIRWRAGFKERECEIINSPTGLGEVNGIEGMQKRCSPLYE